MLINKLNFYLLALWLVCSVAFSDEDDLWKKVASSDDILVGILAKGVAESSGNAVVDWSLVDYSSIKNPVAPVNRKVNLESLSDSENVSAIPPVGSRVIVFTGNSAGAGDDELYVLWPAESSVVKYSPDLEASIKHYLSEIDTVDSKWALLACGEKAKNKTAHEMIKKIRSQQSNYAVKVILGMGDAVVPALVESMSDVSAIDIDLSLPSNGFEEVVYYRPKVFSDIANALLGKITNEVFASINNGGKDETRKRAEKAWKYYLVMNKDRYACVNKP